MYYPVYEVRNTKAYKKGINPDVHKQYKEKEAAAKVTAKAAAKLETDIVGDAVGDLIGNIGQRDRQINEKLAGLSIKRKIRRTIRKIKITPIIRITRLNIL